MDAIVNYGRRILIKITSRLEQHIVGSDQIDYAKFRLQWFRSVVVRFNQARNSLSHGNIPSTLIENLQVVFHIVNHLGPVVQKPVSLTLD